MLWFIGFLRLLPTSFIIHYIPISLPLSGSRVMHKIHNSGINILLVIPLCLSVRTSHVSRHAFVHWVHLKTHTLWFVKYLKKWNRYSFENYTHYWTNTYALESKFSIQQLNHSRHNWILNVVRCKMKITMLITRKTTKSAIITALHGWRND